MSATLRQALLQIVCLVTISSTALADWIEIPHKDNSIRIYSRDIAGSNYKEFKGVVTIKTSMASIIALFDDVSACKNWLHECISAQEIKVIDFSERYIYQVNNVHRFADARDYIFHSKMVQHPASDDISIIMQAKPDFCADNKLPLCQLINHSDYIRITRLVGRYDLEKIDADNIKVTWTQHIEPAGYLQSFITNILLKNIPYHTLNNMRSLVTQDEYRSANFVTDQSGTIIGIKN